MRGKATVQEERELGRGALRIGATMKRKQAYHGGLPAMVSPTWLLPAGKSEQTSKFRSSPDSRRLLLRGNTVWDLLQALKSPGRALSLQLNHLGPKVGGQGGQREENVCSKL